jgi:hypothetical protein
MKKVFIFVVLSSISTLFAQNKTPEQQAKEIVLKLNRELLLSSEQATKLNDLYISSFIEADKVRNDYSLVKEIRKTKLEQIYSNRKNELNSLLNEEQKIKYKQYIESKKTK